VNGTVEVVGVVFSGGGWVTLFDPVGEEYAWNERVICTTARGREYGRVVQANHEVERSELPPREPLRRVVRRATAADDELRVGHRAMAEQAMRVFKQEVLRLRLPVKALHAEVLFDGTRAFVSYAAEERTDLRALALDVGRAAGIRVEARQVGPREGARQIGGYGMCGDKLCSSRFPSHESPITLRMAKDQDLPMNPGRVTGLCGRLRCCLAFEHPVYRSFRDRAPAVGRRVSTPAGEGVVRAYRVPQDSLAVLIDGDERESLFESDAVSELPGPGAGPRAERRRPSR
jgi:cell fate regulator YaaT (PSP1 superfamily)